MKHLPHSILPILFSVVFSATGMAAPEEPRLLYQVAGIFNGAAARDGHLYLARTDSQPGQPDVFVYRLDLGAGAKKIAEITANTGAIGLTLTGNQLFLAQGDDGIEIVDVRDPTKARSLGALALPGYSHEVAVSGQLAMVASGFGGLHLVDIAKPDSPKLLSSYQAYGPPEENTEGVAAKDDGGLFPSSDKTEEGGMVFSGAQDDFYYDADDLPPFQDVDELEVTAEDIRDREGALDVVTDGRFAYLAYGSVGAFIIDVSKPDHPRMVAAIPTNRPAERLALAADHLYVSTGIGGVLVVNVSQPASPKTITTLRGNCYPTDVAATRQRVYIADGYCGTDGLLVFDATDPRNTQLLRSLPGGAGKVRLQDEHMTVIGHEKARGFTTR